MHQIVGTQREALEELLDSATEVMCLRERSLLVSVQMYMMRVGCLKMTARDGQTIRVLIL